MQRKVLTFLFLSLAAWAVVIPTFGMQSGGDPITGKWSGDWGPSKFDRNPATVDLKLNGKTVTGTVNSEGKAVPIKNGTFDPNTKAVHMEADAPGPGERMVHFVIDGKLADDKTLAGTWNHDARKGDFKITKQ